MYEVVTLDEDHGTMICGPVAVVVWTGFSRLDATMDLEELGARALKDHPNGICLLGILEETVSPPSQEVRRMTTEVTLRLMDRGARGAAAVVDTKGFRGAAYRGIITGLSLIAPEPYPFKCFGDLEVCSHWVNALLNQSFDTNELCVALRRFRSEVRAVRSSLDVAV